MVKGYHNVKTKEIKKALLLISGNYIHFACFSAPLWNASTGITAKRCQCQQDWHGQCPFLGGFVENTGRFEGPDKTVPEPSTHSLVLLPGSWNTPLVPVTFFQFGGGNRAKFTLPKGQVLHPETSHHVSYSLHCGFILTLVAKEYGYVATHSPFSSESWEAKMPCNILKVTDWNLNWGKNDKKMQLDYYTNSRKYGKNITCLAIILMKYNFFFFYAAIFR